MPKHLTDRRTAFGRRSDGGRTAFGRRSDRWRTALRAGFLVISYCVLYYFLFKRAFGPMRPTLDKYVFPNSLFYVSPYLISFGHFGPFWGPRKNQSNVTSKKIRGPFRRDNRQSLGSKSYPQNF